MTNKDEEVGNFSEGIHKANYLDNYLTKRLQNTNIDTLVRTTESLNGDWHYGIDQYDTCLRNKWFEETKFTDAGLALPQDANFDEWPTTHLPNSWNTEDDKLFLYEGSMVYTRNFTYEDRGEDRVFIKFGAANYRASIFVNKKFVGTHLGGSTPFTVEVTDILEQFNRILVVVNNTREVDHVPMDNTDWFNYGGIYRNIELIRLPKNFIRNYKIALVPDSHYRKISVDITTDLLEDSDVKLTITGLDIDQSITVKNGAAHEIIDATPALWSPNSPRLYDVDLQLGTDQIHDKIGFREIKIDGREILLNGKPIFLKGISCHEESLKNGKAMTEQEIRENYAIAKEMGCNYMRLAHYPHTELAPRIADEVGLLLWEEIPVYWAIQFENPDTYNDAENQLTELINRDYNRASVIIWSVGNENADTDARLSFMSRLIDRAYQLDGMRLVSAACLYDGQKLVINDRLADKVDIIGINEYCGWYEPDFNSLPKLFANSSTTKPVIITEFGADAKSDQHGTRDEMYTEENQLDVYEKQIATLRDIPYVKGMSPWILYDFRCPRRLHTLQNYYNLKGLLSADKKHRKLAFYALQKFYQTEKN